MSSQGNFKNANRNYLCFEFRKQKNMRHELFKLLAHLLEQNRRINFCRNLSHKFVLEMICSLEMQRVDFQDQCSHCLFYM